MMFLKLVLTIISLALSFPIVANPKMKCWSIPHHGVNMSSQNPEDDFKTASSYGITTVRFGAVGEQNDFRYLLDDNGNWDLSEIKLQRIKDVVEMCRKHNLNVLISLSHIPGRYWAFRKRDVRIWKQSIYQNSFFHAWKKIAGELKDYENVIGYDVINEPYLPQEVGVDPEEINYGKLKLEIRSLLTDINMFYKNTIDSIRSVDKVTPVIVETTGMGAVEAIELLEPINDPYLIYSFHYYRPFVYFSKRANQGRVSYPGKIPIWEKTEDPADFVYWDNKKHLETLKPIIQWQRKHNVPSNRIFVGEFGVWRSANGAQKYLADLTDIFKQQGWSWSYYSFRENSWDHCDLELVGKSSVRKLNPLFNELRLRFK